MSDTAVGSATEVHRYRVYLEDEDGSGQTLEAHSRSIIGAVVQAQKILPDYHATKVERLGE